MQAAAPWRRCALFNRSWGDAVARASLYYFARINGVSVPSRVAPEGSLKAPIILIGEAPGKTEMELGRPFVGPSYKDKLLPWWTDCTPRLDRSMFRILNVLDYQPARIDAVPEHEMRAAIDNHIHAEIAQHEGPDGAGPTVIVPVGNYALYGLTGNGRVSWHRKDNPRLKEERPGIKDWRGSILSYADQRGRVHKVIPSVHPASTFYSEPDLEWVLRMDWQRVATDMGFRELRLPEYVRAIGPSASEVVEFVRWTRSEAAKRKDGAKYFERLACSLDVETPYKTEYATTQAESKSTAASAKCRACGHTKRWHVTSEDVSVATNDGEVPFSKPLCAGLRGKGGCACAGFAGLLGKPRKKKISEDAYLGCVGYCWSPEYTLCVPTTLDYWQDPATLALVFQALREFHADPNIDFGGQYFFSFDAWWCAEYGIPVRNLAWDLLNMHQLQRPWSRWNTLDFQASLDHRAPFWKHEAKLPSELSAWSHNKEQLWAYNCTDNHVQRVLLDRRVEALTAGDRLEYCEQHEIRSAGPYHRVTRTGIRVDDAGRQKEHDRVMAEAVELAAEIKEDAGMAVVAKVAVSVKKMAEFLYTKLRLPVQYAKTKDREGKKVKRISTDIITIRRLMEMFPGLAILQTVGVKVLRHRRFIKVKGFLSATHVSKDGRWYSLFKQDTSLGRSSSSELPDGRGANLQNIDKRLRQYFVADTGKEM